LQAKNLKEEKKGPVATKEKRLTKTQKGGLGEGAKNMGEKKGLGGGDITNGQEERIRREAMGETKGKLVQRGGQVKK